MLKGVVLNVMFFLRSLLKLTSQKERGWAVALSNILGYSSLQSLPSLSATWAAATTG